MSEPVALRYDFDGHGYLYMDAGSGSDWASRVKNCEFLYTHPMRELTDDEIGDVDAKFEKEFSPHGYGMPWENFLVLVKAILKKASEK